MKVKTRLLSILCLMQTAYAAAELNTAGITYYADGIVDTTPNSALVTSVDQLSSDRFYDSNKGAEWTTPYSDGTEGDSLMCWAHAASNVIQYWQSYYGVFYTGDRELPYGKIGTVSVNTYEVAPDTEEYIYTDIANPQQLAVAKAYYENWENRGGKFGPAAEWFFKWDDSDSNGGYYSNYFGNADSTQLSYTTVYSAGIAALGDSGGTTDTTFSDAAGLAEALMPAFGMTSAGGTVYNQTQVGLLPFIGIWYDVALSDGSTLTYGHMLTCYGFTTNTDGSIASIIVANSDDDVSQLQNLYVIEKRRQAHALPQCRRHAALFREELVHR